MAEENSYVGKQIGNYRIVSELGSGGKLYACDYHAGCLGVTTIEKAETINSTIKFQIAAHALIRQLQSMQQIWKDEGRS